MSVKHLALVADITGPSPTCKLVLYALAVASDEKGRSVAPYHRLEQLTGLSERAIRSSLRTLEQRGLVFPNEPYRELRL
jgi:hypothetical protein